uniref:Ig-like domain-containing protein n=1 Tax=Amphilophus citrinellus TaxID=61819 RepID=A0A3Q0S777_AMPCI
MILPSRIQQSHGSFGSHVICQVNCISLLFFFLCPGPTAGDTISPQQAEVTETGQPVTLTCSYQIASARVVYWYSHHSDLHAPQFILLRVSGGGNQYIPDDRYGVETTDTSTTLTIKALTLADTALYYCALETQ